MKHLFNFKSIAFATLVCCVLTANGETTENMSPNDYRTQQYVDALKQGMKFKDLWSQVIVKSQADVDIKKGILENYGEQNMPIPTVKGNELTFTDGKDKLVIEPVDFINQKFKINGYLADFRPHRTLSEKLAYANRVLKSNKKISLLNFKFENSLLLLLKPSDAEAILFVPALIYGGLGVINAVAWGSVVNSLSKNGKPDAFSSLVIEMQNEINKCKKKDGIESFKDAKVRFSCDDINDAQLVVNDVDCFVAKEKKNHTLYDTMKTCCKKSRTTCEERFNSSFPELPSEDPGAKEGYRSGGANN